MWPSEDPLELSTISGEEPDDTAPSRRVVGLTVLAHPSPQRIGDRVALTDLDAGRGVAISRIEPVFSSFDRRPSGPLADRHLSREPSLILEQHGELRLTPQGAGSNVDGEPLTEPVTVDGCRLRRGVVVCMARRVALLLHEIETPLRSSALDLGLVGVSDAMVDARREIERVCDLQVPVLLRGETGTGKELAARAIHTAGGRAKGPFVAVNMAALPPSLAAAELFGAARGAFTGADRSRPGLFREAHGGTLFLDEIGVMPPDVQVQLLRFLEDHVVRSVGADRGETVDVRVVAATDSDLARSVDEGEFSQPLLQRVAGYEIRLPPLRHRSQDLGVLLLHFLKSQLDEVGSAELLDDPGPRKMPWLPAELLCLLVRHRWPGNVRELRNFALRLVVKHHEGSIDLDEVAGGNREASTTGASPPKPRAPEPKTSYRDPADVTDDEIEEAMRASAWEILRAAERLGMSRTSLYKRIDEHPTLRTAATLEADEIEKAMAGSDGSLDALVEALRVSKGALKARMQALGIRRPTTPG